MPYDEALARRAREVVAGIEGDITERKMFGGLAFLLNGHMFAGIVGDELMLRLGPDGAGAALRHEHAREMDFTGRPMKSMVFIAAEGLAGRGLGDWGPSAAAYALTLPPKPR